MTSGRLIEARIGKEKNKLDLCRKSAVNYRVGKDILKSDETIIEKQFQHDFASLGKVLV